MSFTAETIRVSAQSAIYELVRAAILFGVVLFGQPFLATRAAAMNIPGAAAWSLVVIVIAAFFGLIAFDSWRETKALPVRRVRLLEYHAMHFAWVKSKLLDPHTTAEEIKDAERVIWKHRDLLLNLTPHVFDQATADRFRLPTMMAVALTKTVVAGMPHENERIRLIGTIDHLVDAIRLKWIECGGIGAMRP